MAHESSVRVGSGVSILREGLVPGFPTALPGMRGSNAVVINYEDINSCAGISLATAVSVGDLTETELTPAATRLRGRRKMIISNGDFEIFIGPTGVTAATGLRLGASGILQLDILDFGDLFAITLNSTSDVRILELK